MAITVKIMRRAAPGGRPTLYASRDLDALPVSLGRDSACTIVLEDPNKHISRFHVEIEEESGIYWMFVSSKVNPVMVKGRRYGPGTRLVLRSGDSFEVAEYEVQVFVPDPQLDTSPPVGKPQPAPLPEPEPAAEPEPVAKAAPAADDAERLFNESTFFGVEEVPAPKPAPRAEPPRPNRNPSPRLWRLRPPPSRRPCARRLHRRPRSRRPVSRACRAPSTHRPVRRSPGNRGRMGRGTARNSPSPRASPSRRCRPAVLARMMTMAQLSSPMLPFRPSGRARSRKATRSLAFQSFAERPMRLLA